MAIIDLIRALQTELEKKNIVLRSMTVTNIGLLNSDLVQSGEHVERLSLPWRNDDTFLRGNSKYLALLLRDYPWREEYVFPQDMGKRRFLKWRPFFAQLKGKDLVGCEIGVLEGYLSKFVVEHIEPKEYILIDPWLEFEDVCQSINFPQKVFDEMYLEVQRRFRHNPEVKFLRKPSIEAVKEFKDESLDFVYIDGDHSDKAVFLDFKAWYPKIKKGGLIGGHDWREGQVRAGVRGFLNELMGERNPTKLGHEFNDWWFTK